MQAGLGHRRRCEHAVLRCCLIIVAAAASTVTASAQRQPIELRIPGVITEAPPVPGAEPGDERIIKTIPAEEPVATDPVISAAEEDWLSTLYIDNGTQRCTATVIGPRVLLTAAHCLEFGSRMRLSLTPPIDVDCTPHPSYALVGLGSMSDYALCFLSADFPSTLRIRRKVTKGELVDAIERIPAELTNYAKLANEKLLPQLQQSDDVLPSLNALATTVETTGDEPFASDVVDTIKEILGGKAGLIREVPVHFERLSLNVRDSRPRWGDGWSRRVLMAGYGCRTRDQSGGNDGSLQFGFGRVSQFGARWLTVGSELRNDSAILCRGDSGGPTFRVAETDDRDTDPRRLIIAVNAGNVVRGAVQNRSFVAKTATPGFIRFFHAWRRERGIPAVCGVDEDAKMCRD